MFRVPTRPLLKSFWLAASVTAGVLIAAALWWFDVHRAVLWGAAAFAVFSAIGLTWPGIALRPYETWKRLARKARRAARLWLTGVVFVILTVVGWLGGRLSLRSPVPPQSGWIRKSNLPESDHAGDAGLALTADATAGWSRRFGEWALRSGNAWAWSLIPLLALLKGVEGEDRGSLGGNVYTLY